MAGALSLNDVRGGATALVGATSGTASVMTTGGSVLVQAKETSTLTATTTSEVKATQASTSGANSGSTSSSPIVVGGLIGTNLVQSAANAEMEHSAVTTIGTGTGVGAVTVNAQNTATLMASTTNGATATTSSSGSGGSGSGGSGNTAVGVTLAFNTIGWDSENVLFSAIDALLGSSTLASAFGSENPSNATATMLDTTVNATGELTVSAVDGVTLTSTIGNTTTASTTSSSGGSGGSGGNTTGQMGSQNLTLGFVLASNKVAGSAQASISFDTGNLPASTIQAAGGVSVTAQDSSAITATITLGTSSTAPGGSNSGSVTGTGVAGAVSLNDVLGGATASITHTTLSTTGGSVLVQAEEMATLTATTTSEVRRRFIVDS